MSANPISLVRKHRIDRAPMSPSLSTRAVPWLASVGSAVFLALLPLEVRGTLPLIAGLKDAMALRLFGTD